MNQKFDDARKSITEIDKEIARLFEKRMDQVYEIGLVKKEMGIPVFDSEREESLKERNSSYVKNEYRGYYKRFFEKTLEVSKEYQRKIIKGSKVAYSGVEGAFAYIAARKIFPDSELVAYSDFQAAYKAVESGECDEAVLPIENSFAGEVGQTMDLMYSGSLFVNAVYNLKVTQNLLGVKGAKLDDVKTVLSHRQALDQCADYIRNKNLEAKEENNTAKAAKKVAELNDKSTAAIASIETAEIYGLEVLDTNINESDDNVTRFAVFSQIQNEKAGTNYSLLTFTVGNTAGALAKALNIIGAFEFNMNVLRSRPVKETPWEYYFYIELEGDINSDDGKRMLNALSVECKNIKVLGSVDRIIKL